MVSLLVFSCCFTLPLFIACLKQSVEPSSVRIVVVANIILSPSEAYILRYSRFNYTVELLRYNSMKRTLHMIGCVDVLPLSTMLFHPGHFPLLVG